MQATSTGQLEELAIGTIFRSIGYKGQPLGDLPFDNGKGIISNQLGRVEGHPGVYVAGWIKRGPSGVIGTNKPCAKESVQSLLSDAREGKLKDPAGQPQQHLAPGWVDFDGWKRLDEFEVAQGQPLGRPRVKVVDRESMLARARDSAEEVAAR